MLLLFNWLFYEQSVAKSVPALLKGYRKAPLIEISSKKELIFYHYNLKITNDLDKKSKYFSSAYSFLK